jgi:hypothetical protein
MAGVGKSLLSYAGGPLVTLIPPMSAVFAAPNLPACDIGVFPFKRLAGSLLGFSRLPALFGWLGQTADNQSERAVSRPRVFTSLRVKSFQEPTRSFRVRFSGLSCAVFHDRNIAKGSSQNEEFAVGEIRNV